MDSKHKLDIIGCPCYCFKNEEEAFVIVEEIFLSGNGGYSVAINAEKIMLFKNNQEFRNLILNSVLPSPDGAGAVIGMNLFHKRTSIKLDLPRLTLEICNRNSLRLLVLGAIEEVNEKAADVIKERYPNINLVGRMNGYFKTKEEVFSKIKETVPNIVLIALGSPRQENLARELLKENPNVVFIGCGGALDILSGRVERAPKFFIENNLEWFYRLVKQPFRIKRQKILPLFMYTLYSKYIKFKLTGNI